jgi:hypothetical protein
MITALALEPQGHEHPKRMFIGRIVAELANSAASIDSQFNLENFAEIFFSKKSRENFLTLGFQSSHNW